MKAVFDHEKIIAKQVDTMAAELELDDRQKAQLLTLKHEQLTELRGKKEKQRGSEQKAHTFKDKISMESAIAAKHAQEEDEKRHQQNLEKLLKPHQLEKMKARQTNNKPEHPHPQGKK